MELDADEEKLEMVDVDMTGYSNEKWFDELYEWLENYFTPPPPGPKEKPLTVEGLKRQKIVVRKKIADEFHKRFPELLIQDLI